MNVLQNILLSIGASMILLAAVFLVAVTLPLATSYEDGSLAFNSAEIAGASEGEGSEGDNSGDSSGDSSGGGTSGEGSHGGEGGYSQATYYNQGNYYSQPSYYSQSQYYSEGNYYSEGHYYNQGNYYSEGNYYSQGYYQQSYSRNEPSCWIEVGRDNDWNNDSFYGNYKYTHYSAMLAWGSDNATSAYLTGVGSVSTSGSRVVYPSGYQTYTLTVYGPGGSDTCSAYVTPRISPSPPAPALPYVALTQIPYTGFGTPFEAGLISLFAMSVAGASAYVLFRSRHNSLRHFLGFSRSPISLPR